MRRVPIGAPLALLLLLRGGGLQAQEEGFVPLFDGSDLSGWVEMGEPGAFRVEEGTLSLEDPKNYPNWLRSEKEYENFVLKLEYQTVGWSETGIYLHAPLHGNPVKSGLALHLRHDREDEGARSTGALYDVRAPIAFANRTGDEWNRLEIRMDWPELKVILNDTTIQDVNLELSDDLRWRLRSGYLGFEDIGTRIRYRNIRIRELPDTGPEWTELFDGHDLDGWEASGPAGWRVENGALVAGGGEGVLATKDSFGPFELQAYFRTSPHANGGIFYRLKERPDQPSHYEIQIYDVPTATNPTGSIYGIAPARDAGCRSGEWCLLQLISDGAHSLVLVNGEAVAEADRLSLPDEGRIAIQNHSDGTIEYRRIRVRPLRAEH
jgi:hypothetical protein